MAFTNRSRIFLATGVQLVPVISLLVVLSLSFLVTRIATVALTHTGLSRESARFQARSAFTGVGFTTSESENVVNHPVRRRILLLLMLMGNAGIITVMSSLILTFVNVHEAGSLLRQGLLLLGGIAALWMAANSKWVDRHLSNLITWALHKYTSLDVQDYASILQIAGDYRVIELRVEEGDWLAGRSLDELKLSDEGVLVLGINRGGCKYIGAPKGTARINTRDVLILYGRAKCLENLDQRCCGEEGDQQHSIAMKEQERIIHQEAAQDNPLSDIPGV